MLALTVPWALVLLLFLAVVFLIWKKRIIALLIILVLILVNKQFECFPIRLCKQNPSDKEISLKVIGFNIEGSIGSSREKAQSVRNFLQESLPDIVFITEYDERKPNRLDSLLSEVFNYSTYSGQYLFNYFYGNRPFYNFRRLKDTDGKSVGIYTCYITFNGDTIDLYGCHLASNNYNAENKRLSYENIDNKNDLETYLKNMSAAYERRREEVEVLVQELRKSDHQAIIFGDMNDVCGSPAIRELEDYGLIDGWWEGGFGYGATIHKPIPYRIDHIMHTHGLKLEHIKVLDSRGISDHNALYAAFSWNKL